MGGVRSWYEILKICSWWGTLLIYKFEGSESKSWSKGGPETMAIKWPTFENLVMGKYCECEGETLQKVATKFSCLESVNILSAHDL